jgi:hypothetical protein
MCLEAVREAASENLRGHVKVRHRGGMAPRPSHPNRGFMETAELRKSVTRPPNGLRLTGVNRPPLIVALEMPVRGGSRPVQPLCWTGTRDFGVALAMTVRCSTPRAAERQCVPAIQNEPPLTTTPTRADVEDDMRAPADSRSRRGRRPIE